MNAEQVAYAIRGKYENGRAPPADARISCRDVGRAIARIATNVTLFSLFSSYLHTGQEFNKGPNLTVSCDTRRT